MPPLDSPMRRRALLASLAAGTAALAGCATRAGDRATTRRPTDEPTTSDPTTDSSPTAGDGDETAPEDVDWFGQTASVVSLDTQPRVLSLFPTEYRSRDGGRVSMAFARTATADHPATVRVELANENDFSNVFRLTNHPPLAAVPSFTVPVRSDTRSDTGGDHDFAFAQPQHPERVYLAPLPDQSLPVASPEYRRGSNGTWRPVARPDGPWLPETHRLGAGESVSVTFAVVGGTTPEDRIEAAPHELTAGGDRTLTLSAWHPGQPGPTSDSGFAGDSFPVLPGDDETGGPASPDDETGKSSVAWFHEATDDRAVFLRPRSERVTLPETATFSLVNHTTEPATGNPYFWELFKLARGSWHKVAPWAYPVPVSAVLPGDAKQYRLRLSNGEQLPCSNGIAVGHVGGGTYALRVGMSVDDRTHAAVFAVDGDPVSVDPVAAVDASRDGDTVTSTSPKWDAGHGRGTVSVERTDDDGDLLVPELAARRDVYRNTLPFFADGVDAVQLRTSDGVARSAQDAGVVAFRGDAYSFAGTVQTE